MPENKEATSAATSAISAAEPAGDGTQNAPENTAVRDCANVEALARQYRASLAEPGSIVIVGCTGRMGSMLLREATEQQLGCSGIDKPLDDLAPLSTAKLVIVCVPAAVFEETLHIILPAMPSSAILCDITSVKVAPMQQMEYAWPNDVVGTHPLFGPQHRDMPDLPVALVRGKTCSQQSFDLVTAFCALLGYRPFATDADTHDKAMARIQNMNFITSLVYCAQTADDELLRDFITPSFQRRLNAARKLLTEDAPMFAGLYDANPYSMQAVRQFSRLLALASAGDISLLLDKAQRWWKDEAGKTGA